MVNLYNLHDLTAYAEVPQPPEVPSSALTATSANLTWSCPLEKNYSVISYFVNVTVNDPSSVGEDCLNGRNHSYYITVPGSQRYKALKDMSLGRRSNMTLLSCFNVDVQCSHSAIHFLLICCVGKHN